MGSETSCNLLYTV